MGVRSTMVRRGACAAVSVLVVAACGGSDDAAEPGDSGPAEVVTDTAADVQSAVVETTTPTATAAPDPTTAPVTAAPVTTTAPTTTPTTAPETTAAPAPQTTVAPEPTQPESTQPDTTEPVSSGVPVGYRPIFDESGDLRANVPAAWTETNGAPDGEFRQLAAAEDLEGFLAGYTLPGMLLIAGDAAIPEAWVDGLAAALRVAEADGCAVTDTSDYDDGVYTGTEHVLSCGAASTTPHLIGGRDADGELFFLLALVRPTDDLSVRTEVVQSFFVN